MANPTRTLSRTTEDFLYDSFYGGAIGAILGLFTRDRVVFRNGFSLQAGGELVVLLFPDSGSSVTLP